MSSWSAQFAYACAPATATSPDPAQRIATPAGGVILLYQDDVTGRLASPGTGT